MQYNATYDAFNVYIYPAASGAFYSALMYYSPHKDAHVLESINGSPFRKPAAVNFGAAEAVKLAAAPGGQAVAAAVIKGDGGEARLVSYVRAMGQWAALPDLALGRNLTSPFISHLVMLPTGSAVMALYNFGTGPAPPGFGVKRLQVP